jgi:hypothetical protein
MTVTPRSSGPELCNDYSKSIRDLRLARDCKVAFDGPSSLSFFLLSLTLSPQLIVPYFHNLIKFESPQPSLDGRIANRSARLATGIQICSSHALLQVFITGQQRLDKGYTA